jgi:hypothetical protein
MAGLFWLRVIRKNYGAAGGLGGVKGVDNMKRAGLRCINHEMWYECISGKKTNF